MENAIGTAAGQIWQFLKDKGPSSVAAVKKGTALSPELLNRGIGWLAREGKIHFAKKGKTAILSLTG